MSTRYLIQLAHQCLAAMVSLKVSKNRVMVLGDDSFRAPKRTIATVLPGQPGQPEPLGLARPAAHEAGAGSTPVEVFVSAVAAGGPLPDQPAVLPLARVRGQVGAVPVRAVSQIELGDVLGVHSHVA
jgi:hypothetical protein